MTKVSGRKNRCKNRPLYDVKNGRFTTISCKIRDFFMRKHPLSGRTLIFGHFFFGGFPYNYLKSDSLLGNLLP